MADLKPSLPRCPQCGKFHPPLKEGEECPLKDHSVSPESESNLNIHPFISNMKSIIVNNIEKKDIKDIDKFQKYVILELNKIIENYSE